MELKPVPLVEALGVVLGINRSFVELKQLMGERRGLREAGINRSFVELKRPGGRELRGPARGINRSFVELKPDGGSPKKTFSSVSIAPSWS